MDRGSRVSSGQFVYVSLSRYVSMTLVQETSQPPGPLMMHHVGDVVPRTRTRQSDSVMSTRFAEQRLYFKRAIGNDYMPRDPRRD